MQRKGPNALFLLSTLILLFGRKKQAEEEKTPTSTDLTKETFPIPDVLKKTVTDSVFSKARDRLRLANIEREIIGDALTKIYEAEAKGQINEIEKNELVQRYKTDLKRVDSEINTHRKTVDLFELESAKEDLLKSFQEKLMEIDLKINQIRPTITMVMPQKAETVQTPGPVKMEATAVQATSSPKEKSAREKPKNKAEERLETIREEVLKAMERLEQIETEG